MLIKLVINYLELIRNKENFFYNCIYQQSYNRICGMSQETLSKTNGAIQAIIFNRKIVLAYYTLLLTVWQFLTFTENQFENFTKLNYIFLWNGFVEFVHLFLNGSLWKKCSFSKNVLNT